MKAYKIFQVINGELYSMYAGGKAQIHYEPGKKSVGKVFRIEGTRKKIRNPIFAYRTLEDAQDYYFCLSNSFLNVQEYYELREVKGIPWRGKLIGTTVRFTPPGGKLVLELMPIKRVKRETPQGTVLLSSCVPVRKVEEGEG